MDHRRWRILPVRICNPHQCTDNHVPIAVAEEKTSSARASVAGGIPGVHQKSSSVPQWNRRKLGQAGICRSGNTLGGVPEEINDCDFDRGNIYFSYWFACIYILV
ncbi:hypothetical protein M569_13360 [Genlisea aurea]|uniref:Uncharacterized protein n=1 Tax=Genlisea aurea TaxID=192259 RepID=S8DP16_9LAMI|nr:hypothetical protein M569_13360 [Genlisea aurea]